MTNETHAVKSPIVNTTLFSVASFLLWFVMIGGASANHFEYQDSHHQGQHTQTLSPYLGIGVGFGGEEFGRFPDNNGGVDTIRSGGGWLLEGGLAFAVDPSTSLRLTAGYQFDIASRLNGDSMFDRLRFDLMLLRNFDVHEFGAGMTTHTSVGYSCTINSICDGDVEFDHAVGFTLEYSVKIAGGGYHSRGAARRTGLSIGVRYTGIDYRIRSSNQNELTDGDSLTGFVGLLF